MNELITLLKDAIHGLKANLITTLEIKKVPIARPWTSITWEDSYQSYNYLISIY